MLPSMYRCQRRSCANLSLPSEKLKLAVLVAAADTEHFQFSGTFADPIKLLATCERMRP